MRALYSWDICTATLTKGKTVDTTRIIQTLTDFWHDYGQTAITLASALTGLLISLSILRQTKHKWKEAAKAGRTDDLIWHATILLIFSLTAEGMYTLLTQKLNTPLHPVFALATCFGVEALTYVSFVRAKRHNDLHGTPGKHGRAAWIIALAGGSVVALSAGSTAEVALRVLLPLGVAYSWWTELTQGNKEQESTWLWTPARLLTRVGAMRPGKHDASEAELQRKEDKYVELSFLFSGLPSQTPRQRRKRDRVSQRLRKMTLYMPTDMLESATARIQLAYEAEGRVLSARLRGQHNVEHLTTMLVSSYDDKLKVVDSPTTHEAIGAADTPAEQSKAIGGDLVPTTPNALTEIQPRGVARAKANDLEIINENWEGLKSLFSEDSLYRSAVEKLCSNGERKVWRAQALRIIDLVPALIATEASADNDD